jgi:DNA-binding XRE family transcriptional regulator
MGNVKTIRKAAGLTQVQLAQKANVSRFRLCMAESGALELRPDEIEAIRKAVEPEIERTAQIASEFQRSRVARAGAQGGALHV